jgi:hypothetical protein
MSVLAAVDDPDGRRVELVAERWENIVTRHPELADLRGEIMQALSAAPSDRRSGRRPGQEWLYLAAIGPSRWLKVIVDFDAGVGRIVTAFPRRDLP